ncbi:hypothetical protein [Agrococcus jejuensis]|uniref:Uncharacterized protein n=1 Tax=Agrococcus jejuensis TaxID=399736 RepID=A0A1G8DLN8_9MICO|nr:hypothetical protein [Agrococcus jejuensis]SDH58596.1 hypothetical protein SAMN04489720_1693 [Agrococcus jejuensis]
MAERTRILTSAASIASSGAFTLIPIGRLPRGARWGIGVGLSFVPAAVAASLAHRRMRERVASERIPTTAGVGVAVGAVSLGAWEASARVDRAVDEALVRRGVRRPRVVMAIGAAAIAGAIELLDVVASRRAEG